MGHKKMDWENIFNIKKKDINPLSRVCHFDLLSLFIIEVWSELQAF